MIRFLDSARFMKDSLDNLVNNLSGGIYKRTCKNCMKPKDCKKYEEVKDNTVEWCGEYKDCKNCHIIVKNAIKYMKTVNVILNR